jgi:hypothetical protein
MRSLATAVVLIALAAPVASAQQGEPHRDPSFSDLLAVAGLEHLSAEDQSKIERLVLGLNQATTTDSQEKAEAFDSVVGFLREQGFEPELVMASSRDDQPILIVGRILRQFTADLPATLPAADWKNGVYFVKWTNDGATAMIVNGQVHDFAASTWRLF